VIIANNLAVLWQEVNEIGLAAISTGLVWLSIVAFGLQIYFEFSGYAQMAVGLAKLFGFHLPKNFDDPYSANSITNFWRRWNISLGRWFREYIYIPLGGSRKKFGFTMLNLLLVWLLTGLWHGAALNFVIWGLYFFIFIIIERLGFQGFLNKHKILSRFYVVLVLLVGWAIFASTDFANMGLLLTKMFVPSFLNGDATVTIWYYLRNYAVTMLIAVFFSMSVSTKLYAKLRQNRLLRNIALILLFLVCLAYLVEPALNPFRFMGF
jgi:Predicted membrane protein involved in D-alanine export